MLLFKGYRRSAMTGFMANAVTPMNCLLSELPKLSVIGLVIRGFCRILV